ncbi:hypothetical protein BGW39_004726 [Mortierella sp. 14UC]|nr:hypothetical protein BGW39_004726 [Mortierella sp. 14UC]
MSASRAFRSAANSLAGSNLTRTRIASTLSGPRPSATALRQAHLSFRPQRATTTATSRGYASISTKTTSAPQHLNSTAGLTPGARAIIATTRGVRNVLIIATSTLAIGYFFFAGAHAYLEQYKCPSPQGVSTQVQRCLHGAWVREEISPDPDVAELYLQKAVEMARQDLEAYYAKRNKNVEGQQQDERLAFLEIEKDQALVEIQNRLARFYGRIGRDEQAATVWTRLWKLSEKEGPRSTSSSSGASGLGSLFGGASADRPLISQKDAIPFAKSAADCWMRMGEYEMAEEALAWTLSTLASTTASTSTSPSTTSRIEEIGLLSTLGALYVRQAKFEYALSLFVKALQAVQDHRAQNDNSIEAAAGGIVGEKAAAALKEDRNMWYCREAILTQSIGETLYGAATQSPSSSSSTTTTTTTTTEPKKSSSWKFWSSSSSPTPTKPSKVVSEKSPEQTKKEEEALGWMQKALAMAKAKSGEHRDCGECAALGLNNLGLINEMEGKTEVALAQFREAVLHATMAKDYVGIDDYNSNIARLTEQTDADSESTPISTAITPA